MKNNSTTYQGQNFIDKVLETTGNIENVFEMALLNNISITDDLPIGTELKTSKATNLEIVELFGEFNKPATAITEQSIITYIGIGKMSIETTFIVQ